jgi:hypothetical protein
MRGAVSGAAALERRIAWMILLQTVYGAILAVACLRPSFRTRLGGRAKRERAGRSQSRTVAAHARPFGSRPRPPCGDDPMFWKDVRLPRTAVFYRLLGLLVTLILAGLLVWSTTALAVPAFRELLRDGYGIAPAGSARAVFDVYLRVLVETSDHDQRLGQVIQPLEDGSRGLGSGLAPPVHRGATGSRGNPQDDGQQDPGLVEAQAHGHSRHGDLLLLGQREVKGPKEPVLRFGVLATEGFVLSEQFLAGWSPLCARPRRRPGPAEHGCTRTGGCNPTAGPAR